MSRKKTKGKPRKNDGNEQKQQPEQKQLVTAEPSTALTHPQSAIKDDDTDASDKGDKPKAWWSINRRWVSSAVAIGTVLAALFGYYQWDATRWQARIMLEQLEMAKREQSPNLTFSDPYAAPPVVGEHLHGTITVRNSGKLPAKVTSQRVGAVFSPVIEAQAITKHGQRANIDCDIDYRAILDELTGPDPVMATGATILPGASETFNWSGSRRLVEGEVGTFRYGSHGFAIVPHVEYSDAAQGSYETTACFFYTLRTSLPLKCPRYDRTEKERDKPVPESSAKFMPDFFRKISKPPELREPENNPKEGAP